MHSWSIFSQPFHFQSFLSQAGPQTGLNIPCKRVQGLLLWDWWQVSLFLSFLRLQNDVCLFSVQSHPWMLGSGWTPSWGNSKNWGFQRLPINLSVTLMSQTYAGTPLTSETISGEQVHWFEDFWNRKSYSSGPFCTTSIQTACREMDGALNLTQGCFYFSPSLKS